MDDLSASLFFLKWWYCAQNRGFLKWWYPTTMGFPTKNYHFGVFGGYLTKPPNIEIDFPLSFRANMNTITKILLGDPPKHRHRTRKCTNMEETVNQFCKQSLNHVQFPAICKAVSPSSKTPDDFFKTQTSSKTSESSFYEGSLFQLLTRSQNIFQTEKKNTFLHQVGH